MKSYEGSSPDESKRVALTDGICAKFENLATALDGIAMELDILRTRTTPQGIFQRLKTFFTTADIAADIKNCTTKLDRQIEEFELALHVENSKRLTRLEENQVSASEAATLKALKPVKDANYRTDKLNAPRSCMEGTRVKLLQDIRARLKDTAKGAPRIIWMKGGAGTGKSTVSRSICEHAASTDIGALGASFLCSRTGEAALSDPRAILHTIAFQLARFDPTYRREVVKILEDPTSDALSSTFQEEFSKLIVSPLQCIDSEAKPLVLIVLDALDECEETGVKKLLTVLVNAAYDLPPHVKFLVTSRPEVHIRSILEPPSVVAPHSAEPEDPSSSNSPSASTPNHPVFVPDIESAADVQSDIRAYLNGELDSVSASLARRGVRFSVSLADRETLATRSGKLFIIAATYARFIGDEKLANPTGRLKNIIDCPTPSGVPSIPELDRLYTTVLQTATPQFASLEEEEEHFTRLRNVLGMIVLLREELSIVDMERLAGLDPEDGDIRIALNLLHSVISVPASDQEGSPRVQHPSFADFLCNPTRCTDKRFLLDVEKQQNGLAIACFGRLADSLTHRFPHHTDPAVANTEVEDLAQKMSTTFSSEALYACRHWAPHLSRAAVGHTHLLENLEEFLQKRLIWWMEVMSLLEAMNGAVDEVVLAQRWANTASVSVITSSLLNDAYRLILACLATVTRSAPQLYRSVLAFIPKSTALHVFYHHMTDANIDVVIGQDEGWSPRLATLRGHTDDVKCLAFSADSKLIASADDCQIKIWNGNTGAAMTNMRSTNWGDGNFRSLTFSPDASRITLVSSDTISQWEVATAFLIKALPSSSLRSLLDSKLSADGRRLVVKTQNRASLSKPQEPRVCLYDWATGDLVSELPLSSKFNFSPDSKCLAYVQNDGTPCLCDARTGELIAELDGHSSVRCISFSPDSHRLVTTSYGPDISCLWDSVSGQLIKRLRGLDYFSSPFSPNSGRLVTKTWHDGQIHLWKAVDGTLITTLSFPNRETICSWAFSPDSRILAYWSEDGAASLLNGETGEPFAALPPIGTSPFGHPNLTFLPGDRLQILQSSCSGKFRLCEISSNSVSYLAECADEFRDVALWVAPSQNLLVMREAKESITYQLWDTESGARLELAFPTDRSRGFRFEFSPDSRRIASWHGPEICLWDTAINRTSSEGRGPLDSVASIRFSPDGRFLAVTSESGSVLLFDSAAGTSTPTQASLLRWARSPEFSPDSGRIAFASRSGTIWLGDTRTGGTIAELEGHHDAIHGAAFSQDGQRLAAWSTSYKREPNDSETLIHVWDLVTRCPTATMTGVGRMVNRLVFSPDGLMLLSFELDSNTKLWNTQDGKLIMNCEDRRGAITFSPNSQKLALWRPDTRTFDLCNCVTGELLFSLRCPLQEPGSGSSFFGRQHLAFSPDSQYLASALDSTLQLWSAREGTCIHILPALSYSPESISFSADGEWLICEEVGGRIHRFHAGAKETWLVPLGQSHSISLADPETNPTFDLGDDHSLYLISAPGKRIQCCALPALMSIQYERFRPMIEFFQNTVAIGCTDGRVLVLRVSM